MKSMYRFVSTELRSLFATGKWEVRSRDQKWQTTFSISLLISLFLYVLRVYLAEEEYIRLFNHDTFTCSPTEYSRNL